MDRGRPVSRGVAWLSGYVLVAIGALMAAGVAAVAMVAGAPPFACGAAVAAVAFILHELLWIRMVLSAPAPRTAADLLAELRAAVAVEDLSAADRLFLRDLQVLDDQIAQVQRVNEAVRDEAFLAELREAGRG